MVVLITPFSSNQRASRSGYPTNTSSSPASRGLSQKVRAMWSCSATRPLCALCISRKSRRHDLCIGVCKVTGLSLCCLSPPQAWWRRTLTGRVSWSRPSVSCTSWPSRPTISARSSCSAAPSSYWTSSLKRPMPQPRRRSKPKATLRSQLNKVYKYAQEVNRAVSSLAKFICTSKL